MLKCEQGFSTMFPLIIILQ